MIINWNKNQLELLCKFNFDFNVSDIITYERYSAIEEAAGDYLMEHGIGENDEVNSIGILCESIIDLMNDTYDELKEAGKTPF